MNSQNYFGRRSALSAGGMIVALFFANPSSAQEKTFDGFPAVRQEVLGMIGTATSEIKIVTDFLSDGDIVSALYVAMYRKVDVGVLLGPARATHIMSRLNYLKSQNIPVWLRPRGFMAKHSTLLLVDGKLYGLNAELDSQARHRKFNVVLLSQSELVEFQDGFTKAQGGVSPIPRAMPLVGRAGRSGRPTARIYSPDDAASSNDRDAATTGASSAPGDLNQPYRYSRERRSAPKGVPTKFPRNTIQQEREARRDQATDH